MTTVLDEDRRLVYDDISRFANDAFGGFPVRNNLLILGFGVLMFIAAAAGLVASPDVNEVHPVAGDAPRRVHVLFLGDNGHHTPLERCRDVASIMGQRGIDLVYTDDLNDLNPQTLGRYDVLMLYANWPKISPEQEKSLLDFVESGHGFAPIHCGSYCFLNSPKITALTGARFKSHKTGVFKETIADPENPIEKGLKPIESWDETYVHQMHNETNRHVLSYRIEGDVKEPYTWTRTEGMGRVFYTAWGHDERTWQNEDFQNLLERGLRWAAGDWALLPQPQGSDFSYAPQNIPFYPPGKSAGVTLKPITEMQDPVSPQVSMKHMVVRPGFDVKLVASDPDIMKPICMAFDERGRLWVAETFDYPNNMQDPGNGHDRITICEDTKGTGVCDKFTVFADKLSIPTSMVFANGGVIVTQAPGCPLPQGHQGRRPRRCPQSPLHRIWYSRYPCRTKQPPIRIR
jgi:type 1 glutamine amidotransferase